jgi:hypothetical protein
MTGVADRYRRRRGTDLAPDLPTEGSDASSTALTAPEPRPSTRPFIAGRAVGVFATAAVLLGVLSLGAIVAASRSAAAAPPVATAPTSATFSTISVASSVGPAGSSGCPTIAPWLDVVGSYEHQGLWSVAASSAQTALRTPDLCADDRDTLARKMLAVAGEALLVEPPPPEDAPGQRRAADAYVALKALAAQYGQPAPPPLPIGRGAFDHRLYLLATAAFGDAFTSGDASLADRDVVRADFTSRRALGLAWAQQQDQAVRSQGLVWLATACRIDEQVQVASGEACLDLGKLVGPREKWPLPLPDPILAPPHAAGQ